MSVQGVIFLVGGKTRVYPLVKLIEFPLPVLLGTHIEIVLTYMHVQGQLPLFSRAPSWQAWNLQSCINP